MRTVFAFFLLTLTTVPAAAEFYIVRDVEKQTCTVAQDVPKDDQHVMVGEGAYNDEASAASDLKTMLVCNPGDATRGVTPRSPSGLRVQ